MNRSLTKTIHEIYLPVVGADGSDASKLRITLANTLRDLKSLHVAMQMGVNEIEEKLKTTVELEAETKKMNYRILHLKKSVKESES